MFFKDKRGKCPSGFYSLLGGVLSSLHFAVDLDLCLDRYGQLCTPRLCQYLLFPLSRFRLFRSLIRLSIPRGNDTVLTLVRPGASFKSEVFFVVSPGKTSTWLYKILKYLSASPKLIVKWLPLGSSNEEKRGIRCLFIPVSSPFFTRDRTTVAPFVATPQ